MKGGRLRPPSPFHFIRANAVEGRENIESSQARSFSRRFMEAALPRGGTLIATEPNAKRAGSNRS